MTLPQKRIIIFPTNSLLKNSHNIDLAVEKAAKIVFALRKFSRQDHTDSKIETVINDTIETVLTLYHNRTKHGIDIIRKYYACPKVICYADEIQLVWTNIIFNSLQSMRLTGMLTIEVSQLDDQIKVSFTDTSEGIAKEIQPKVFTPFFTTKNQGQWLGFEYLRISLINMKALFNLKLKWVKVLNFMFILGMTNN